MAAVPPFGELIEATERTAVCLGTRDVYTPYDSTFSAWMAGYAFPAPFLRGWSDLVRFHVARGVQFRRARVVSEPLSDYVRFEHAVTEEVSVAAGEQVRWLPRRLGGLLGVPLNDFWIFDGRLVRFAYFAGNGELAGYELSDDPAVVAICVQSFEAVWELAIPHGSYKPADGHIGN